MKVHFPSYIWWLALTCVFAVGCERQGNGQVSPDSIPSASLDHLQPAEPTTTLPIVSEKSDTDSTWARGADTLRNNIDKQDISSPDGTVKISVQFTPGGDGDRNLSLHVAVHQNIEEIVLDEGADELLWSPDSRAFFVNGAFNSYSGFFVTAYSLQNDRFERLDVTQFAQRDMVQQFPPCRAAGRDDQWCKYIESEAGFNMSGLDWVNGSSSIIVFAQVPPSSSYGGIMGQVMGYELELPSGRIIKRMSAQETKTAWQSSAAWDIHIPSPPTYGPAYIQ